MDAELDDLRSMMRWAIRTDDAETVVRLAAPLFPYWWSRGLLAPMRELADQAAALPSAAGLPPDAAALLLWARGMLRIAVGDVAAARPYLAQLRDATGELGDRRLRAHALAGLGLAEAAPGAQADLDQLDEAVATFRELGDDWGLAFALSARGQLALLAGDAATATRLHTDALAAADRIDSGHLRAQVLDLLGADTAAERGPGRRVGAVRRRGQGARGADGPGGLGVLPGRVRRAGAGRRRRGAGGRAAGRGRARPGGGRGRGLAGDAAAGRRAGRRGRRQRSVRPPAAEARARGARRRIPEALDWAREATQPKPSPPDAPAERPPGPSRTRPESAGGPVAAAQSRRRPPDGAS